MGEQWQADRGNKWSPYFMVAYKGLFLRRDTCVYHSNHLPWSLLKVMCWHTHCRKHHFTATIIIMPFDLCGCQHFQTSLINKVHVCFYVWRTPTPSMQSLSHPCSCKQFHRSRYHQWTLRLSDSQRLVYAHLDELAISFTCITPQLEANLLRV